MDIIERGGEFIFLICEFERVGLDGNVCFDFGIFFVIFVDVILV